MSLLREAHARRLLDFKDADLLDRGWTRRTDWLLDWLERQLLSELCQMKHLLHSCLLSYTLDKGTFDLHWEQAQVAQDAVAWHKLPWLKIDGGPTRKEVQSLTESWKDVFGDPKDPEVAQRIAATAQALRKRAGLE